MMEKHIAIGRTGGRAAIYGRVEAS